MNLSAPFIRRPIAATLLTLAVALAGITAYALLPVSPLPQVDFNTIIVWADLPGASPESMASTVATPLERSLGRIDGVTEMTSESTQGETRVVLQFYLGKDIDAAARDVQAAINAARSTLPVLPTNPRYRKMNPADAPIMILALTSESLSRGELYDAASIVLAQKISQVEGVGRVTLGGSTLPAVRVDIDAPTLNNLGISLGEVRQTVNRANGNLPKGVLEDGQTRMFIGANDRLRTAEDFAPLIVRYQQGRSVRLSDVATVRDGMENELTAGYANGKPAVVVVIYRMPGSNIIETVRRVKETLPLLRARLPKDADMHVVMDRSPSIANSVREVEKTLGISMCLVVLVVYLFLRNGRATLIPAVAVPVSLFGTFAGMYLAGFSLNHLSLMALTIAVGFVVDDAIVVTENIIRHVEDGEQPRPAAFKGSREVAFTVVSISFSLIAVFIPILFMGGIEGRLFREFAVTLSMAVLISLAVSLATTPMMCSTVLSTAPPPLPDTRPGLWPKTKRRFTRTLRLWSYFMDSMNEHYARTLAVVLRHPRLTLCSLLAVIALNVYLYIIVPKGFFPVQDTGQAFGMVKTDQSASFQAVRKKMAVILKVVQSDPNVATVSGFTENNNGFIFLGLKPSGQRSKSTMQVLAELGDKLKNFPGADLLLQPMQDVRMGGRRSSSMYQYTLRSDDLEALRRWGPRVADAFRTIPGLSGVDSDQSTRGLEIRLHMARDTMARMGVTMQQADMALGLAFGSTIASTIYTDKNQYRVIVAFHDVFTQGPRGLDQLYVPTGAAGALNLPTGVGGLGTGLGGNVSSSLVGAVAGGPLTPLGSFAKSELDLGPTSVSHQGQFSSVTISFNLNPGASLSQAQERIQEKITAMELPPSIYGGFEGTAKLYAQSQTGRILLIVAALVTLYIVLGVLYESLIHPLTILSTLPSAGVGAILGLQLFGAEFTLVAFIGVLLLAGIVKKNAIMMIDFAVEARRNRGLSARQAIYEACLLRFRPIMMTTMTTIFGAIPLLLGRGDGAELRTPLGITIVGGLLVSQLLTLYTTPVVYLYLDRFSREPERTARLARLLGEEGAPARDA